MYQSSVNVFRHYLIQLAHITEIAEQADIHNTLYSASLTTGMFALDQQAKTAISFVYRTLCPLANIDIPKREANPDNWLGLKTDIKHALYFIDQLTPEQFSKSHLRTINTKAGFNDLTFNAPDFLNLYALPNFFFHFNMVYAILRQEKINISKGDYDGFHDYPSDFSFLTQEAS
ncbi:DUF1993 family protein [Algibacillus agarilyticus]|uniref:DUF1993 family protein n=1 Tax=Algibacillus agarilyticus TaxID=2234133 RepID=UPI000DD04534|nr:DUF1993 family protein [Algibacillus agarilyticus]